MFLVFFFNIFPILHRKNQLLDVNVPINRYALDLTYGHSVVKPPQILAIYIDNEANVIGHDLNGMALLALEWAISDSLLVAPYIVQLRIHDNLVLLKPWIEMERDSAARFQIDFHANKYLI